MCACNALKVLKRKKEKKGAIEKKWELKESKEDERNSAKRAEGLVVSERGSEQNPVWRRYCLLKIWFEMLCCLCVGTVGRREGRETTNDFGGGTTRQDRENI